jgi:hypothetical protein
MRHREIHILNLPWTISLIFQFAKSLLSEKIRNRIQIYSGRHFYLIFLWNSFA